MYIYKLYGYFIYLNFCFDEEQQSINFSMLEYQAKWVAHVLAGKSILPSEKEMLADVEKHYMDMELTGVPKHHTHTLPLDKVVRICMYFFFNIK